MKLSEGNEKSRKETDFHLGSENKTIRKEIRFIGKLERRKRRLLGATRFVLFAVLMVINAVQLKEARFWV